MLCVLFEAKSVKKSESVTHIWVTGGGEESRNMKFLKCCDTSLPLCPLCVPKPPHKLQKMMLPDVLCCCFPHRNGRENQNIHCQTILGTQISAL
jgi:hypothetical protein